MKKIIFFSSVLLLSFLVSTSFSQCVYCPNSTTSNNGSAIGYFNIANGIGSIAMGVSSTSSSQGSIAIGRYLTVPSGFPYNIVMGSGYSDAQRLVNNIGPCLMVGFNSDVHTFLVYPASGLGKSGKVSIGNVLFPQTKLHIKADSEEDASLLLEAPGTNRSAALVLNGPKNIISTPSREIPLSFLTGGENTRMVITAETGKIGIGDFSASEPEGKVHIKAQDYEDATVIIEPSATSRVSGLLFKNSPGNIATLDASQPINFYTGSTTLRMKIDPNGNVGIGTENPVRPLHVEGSSLFNGDIYISQANIYADGEIHAKKFRANISPWPDFVFDDNYTLISIPDLESYIIHNGHLPGIPSSTEATINGIELGEMNAILLQKIEELTIYIIQQNKEIDKLKNALNIAK